MSANVYASKVKTESGEIEVEGFRTKRAAFVMLIIRGDDGFDTLSVDQAKLLIAMLQDAVAAVEAPR